MPRSSRCTPKPPAIALVRNDDSAAPVRSPRNRTAVYPSIDGTLRLAIRTADSFDAPVMLLVEMSTDTMLSGFEELVLLLEEYSLRHFPGPPQLSLAGS